MLRHHYMNELGIEQIALTIAADTNDVNLLTLVTTYLGVSPVSTVYVTLTVNSGIVVGSTSGAALTVPALPSGSTVLIVNQGIIAGKGGAGGGGSDGSGSGASGSNGTDAISLGHNVTINNTAGTIGGGGGGGGGGGSTLEPFWGLLGGGGGGGGAGRTAGTAGAGATGSTDGAGADGSAGTLLSGGSGGGGAAQHAYTAPGGGSGGALGANGSWGSDGDAQYGGFSGSPGKAIALNGYTVNWLGGNNGLQVLGAVA